MATLTIASLTIREAARRRLVLALVILTLVVIGFTGWGFQHLTHLTGPGTQPLPAGELRLGTAQVLILVEFMFSGVLALSAVAAASPSISGEVELGSRWRCWAARWDVTRWCSVSGSGSPP